MKRRLLQSCGVLILLYLIQGCFVGFTFSVKLLVQRHNATETQQGTLSWANYPFSFKFIWAAAIDSCYSERLGRRRTWLVLILPSLSVLILSASFWFDQWVEQLDILKLTTMLFTGQVLIASLDVCVDGWSLVLLDEDERPLQANCNASGFSLGFFLGSGLFLSLTDVDFCQKWFDLAPLSHASAMRLLAGSLLAVLVVVLTVKPRDESNDDQGPTLSESFTKMVKLIKLAKFRKWIFLLLTCYIGLGPTLDLQDLQIVNSGVDYTSLGWIRSLSMPIKCLVSLLSYRLSRSYPLHLWYYSLLLLQIIFILVTLLLNYYNHLVALSLLLVIFECFKATLVVGVMSFHATMSEVKFGGLMMAIYAAFSNLGKTWPGTVSLFVMGHVGDYNVICIGCSVFALVWLVASKGTIDAFAQPHFQLSDATSEPLSDDDVGEQKNALLSLK